MSQAVAGVGTSFRRWNGANWVEIAEVKTITGPNKSRAVIDVTSLDSVAGYNEFIGGFRDGGTVVLAMIFRRDTYEIMNDDYDDDELQGYEIFLPDGEFTSFEFEGLVTELGLNTNPADAIAVDVTIKISGQPVVNSGSGSSI